jgi:hypothetical protein
MRPERPHRQVEEKQKRIEFLEKADGQPQIHAERDRKLEAARKQRQVRRQQATWRTEKHVSDSPSNE